MKINRLCILSISLSALTACGGANVDHIAQDRSESLTGIDADHNGIRDDIDHYIIENFVHDSKRHALQQLARQLQQVMQMDFKDDAIDSYKVRMLAFEQSRAIGCVYENFPEEQPLKARDVVKTLIVLTANTKARSKQRNAMSQALDGAALTVPMDNLCD